MSLKNRTSRIAGLFAVAVAAINLGCGGTGAPTSQKPSQPTITATLTAGTAPVAVAVNTATNQILVAGSGAPGGDPNDCSGAPGTVTVIDGSTTSTTGPVAVGNNGGPYPFAIAVDAASNTAYVLSRGHLIADGQCFTDEPAKLIAVGGTLPSTSTVTGGVGKGQGGQNMALNPVNNKLYVSDFIGNSVIVVDTTTNSVANTIPLGFSPNDVAVNPATNVIYVGGAGNFGIIDGATNALTTIADSDSAAQLAVNPTNNKIYATNSGSNSITVLDGATNSLATVADPNAVSPCVIAINTTTNKIYVANSGSNNVTVIDGNTNSVTTVAAGTAPCGLAVDLAHNRVYVTNSGNSSGDPGSITVIDSATNSVAILIDPKAVRPTAVAVDSVNSMIYVANNGSNNVTVIDGVQ